MVTDVNSLGIYTDIIQPILQKKCQGCHNSRKQKGGLNMATVQGLRQGGKTGAVFVANNIAESPLVQRLHLPIDDDLHMPPSGKIQLTEEEITLLEWWINEGADFTKKVSEASQPDNITSILKTYEYQESDLDTVDLQPVSSAMIQKMAQSGIPVLRLNEDSPLVFVNLSRDSLLSRKKIKRLQSIADHIFELDLSFSNVDDQMLSPLKDFKNLTRLKLQQTRVSSDGISAISALSRLKSLNLYGTNVDEDVFRHIEKLKSLESLYLWQTDIPEKAITSFADANPQLRIDRGVNYDLFGEVQLKPPVIEADKDLFSDTLSVSLTYNFKDVDIFYTTDGSLPDSTSAKYSGPVTIDKTTSFKAICMKSGWLPSPLAASTFVKVGYEIKSVQLSQPPSDKYKAQGKSSLIDLEKGTKFFDGKWLGWEGKNLTITADLGAEKPISNVVLSVLEDTGSYIFFPKNVTVSTSTDGKIFNVKNKISIPTAEENHPSETRYLLLPLDSVSAQFVRIKINATLKNPEWHPAPGVKNWLFVDEVLVN